MRCRDMLFGRSRSADQPGETPTPAGAAFAEYRAETLRRLEQEQREFQDFVGRMRAAKDKQEFDQFLARRRDNQLRRLDGA